MFRGLTSSIFKPKKIRGFELEALNLDDNLNLSNYLEDFVKENPLPNTVFDFGNLYQQVMQNLTILLKLLSKLALI